MIVGAIIALAGVSLGVLVAEWDVRRRVTAKYWEGVDHGKLWAKEES